MANVILNVPDISCAHCERTVLETLQGRAGVNAVQVDIPAKKVYLDYDRDALSLDEVSAALDEEGYPVASVAEGKAPERRGFIPLTGR